MSQHCGKLSLLLAFSMMILPLFTLDFFSYTKLTTQTMPCPNWMTSCLLSIFAIFFLPDKELSEGVILNGFVDLPRDRSDVVLLILFYSVLSICVVSYI